MTTLLLTLHGNPGDPADFAPLLAALAPPASCRVIAPARPDRPRDLEQALAAIDQACAEHPHDRLLLLGYSWGAYLAAAWALSRAGRADRLALLNPLLVSERPIPPLVSALLAIPRLAESLLERTVDERAQRFIDDLFEPDAPELALRCELAERLSNAGVWLRAVRCKQLHLRTPLRGCLSSPVLVLRGDDDHVADWQVQAPALRSLAADAVVRTITDAGHSLPWTHAPEVTAALREFLHL